MLQCYKPYNIAEALDTIGYNVILLVSVFICLYAIPHYIKRKKGNTQKHKNLSIDSHLHGMVLDVYFNIYFTLGWMVGLFCYLQLKTCVISLFVKSLPFSKYIDIVVLIQQTNKAYIPDSILQNKTCRYHSAICKEVFSLVQNDRVKSCECDASSITSI